MAFSSCLYTVVIPFTCSWKCFAHSCWYLMISWLVSLFMLDSVRATPPAPCIWGFEDWCYCWFSLFCCNFWPRLFPLGLLISCWAWRLELEDALAGAGCYVVYSSIESYLSSSPGLSIYSNYLADYAPKVSWLLWNDYYCYYYISIYSLRNWAIYGFFINYFNWSIDILPPIEFFESSCISTIDLVVFSGIYWFYSDCF